MYLIKGEKMKKNIKIIEHDNYINYHIILFLLNRTNHCKKLPELFEDEIFQLSDNMAKTLGISHIQIDLDRMDQKIDQVIADREIDPEFYELNKKLNKKFWQFWL